MEECASKTDPLNRLREAAALLGFISIGVYLRILEVSQPFVDRWSWRQADVAMIAKNFYRHSFNIFYPRINWAGDTPGYVGTEFPLVPFVASLMYVPFGIHEWIGRSVAVFFFAVSVPFLYLLVKKSYNERTALFAIATYGLTPLAVFTGRSFMSDMPAVSFSVMALYLFTEALDGPPNGRGKLLIVAGVLTSLAILVKLSAIAIGLPLLYIAWCRYGIQALLMKRLRAFATLALVPAVSWYAHAYRISITHAPYHMFGSGGIGLGSLATYAEMLGNAATGLTPLLAAATVCGIFLSAPGEYDRVFHWWLVGIVLLTFIAAPGHLHPWYLLPIVPIAAAFAGRLCDCILGKIGESSLRKVVLTSVLFCTLSYLSFSYLKPLYEPWALSSLRAGVELDRIAAPDALALVVDGGDPTCLYYSGRKGWHFLEQFGSTPETSRDAITALEKLRRQGADYLVFPQYSLWWLDYFSEFRDHLDGSYRRVRNTEDYVIFDLAVTRNQEPSSGH